MILYFAINFNSTQYDGSQDLADGGKYSPSLRNSKQAPSHLTPYHIAPHPKNLRVHIITITLNYDVLIIVGSILAPRTLHKIRKICIRQIFKCLLTQYGMTS